MLQIKIMKDDEVELGADDIGNGKTLSRQHGAVKSNF